MVETSISFRTIVTFLLTLLVLSFLVFLRLLYLLPRPRPQFSLSSSSTTTTKHDSNKQNVKERFNIKSLFQNTNNAASSSLPFNLIIVLGSGGHTAEMFRLLSPLTDLMSHTKRTYIFSSGDAYSARHAVEFEKRQSQSQGQNQSQGHDQQQNHGQDVNYDDDTKHNNNGDEGYIVGGGEGERKDHNYNINNHGYSLHEIPRARKIKQSWWTTPISCIKCFLACMTVVQKADVVICNGPGTAVMVVAACWVFKFLSLSSTRIIYVESFARVTTLSLSGRLLLPIVDRFLVQWPQLVEKYPRAEYRGVLVAM